MNTDHTAQGPSKGKGLAQSAPNLSPATQMPPPPSKAPQFMPGALTVQRESAQYTVQRDTPVEEPARWKKFFGVHKAQKLRPPARDADGWQRVMSPVPVGLVPNLRSGTQVLCEDGRSIVFGEPLPGIYDNYKVIAWRQVDNVYNVDA